MNLQKPSWRRNGSIYSERQHCHLAAVEAIVVAINSSHWVFDQMFWFVG